VGGDSGDAPKFDHDRIRLSLDEKDHAIPAVRPVVQLRAAKNDTSNLSSICDMADQVKASLLCFQSPDPAHRHVVAADAARPHPVPQVGIIHPLNDERAKITIIVVSGTQPSALDLAAGAVGARVKLQRAVVARVARSAAAHVVANAAAMPRAAVWTHSLMKEMLRRHYHIATGARGLRIGVIGSHPLEAMIVVKVVVLMLKLDAVVRVGSEGYGRGCGDDGPIKERRAGAVCEHAAELVP